MRQYTKYPIYQIWNAIKNLPKDNLIDLRNCINEIKNSYVINPTKFIGDIYEYICLYYFLTKNLKAILYKDYAIKYNLSMQDTGFDLIIENDPPIPVQCKYHNNKNISSNRIKKFSQKITAENYEQGILITNNGNLDENMYVREKKIKLIILDKWPENINELQLVANKEFIKAMNLANIVVTGTLNQRKEIYKNINNEFDTRDYLSLLAFYIRDNNELPKGKLGLGKWWKNIKHIVNNREHEMYKWIAGISKKYSMAYDLSMAKNKLDEIIDCPPKLKKKIEIINIKTSKKECETQFWQDMHKISCSENSNLKEHLFIQFVEIYGEIPETIIMKKYVLDRKINVEFNVLKEWFESQLKELKQQLKYKQLEDTTIYKRFDNQIIKKYIIERISNKKTSAEFNERLNELENFIEENQILPTEKSNKLLWNFINNTMQKIKKGDLKVIRDDIKHEILAKRWFDKEMEIIPRINSLDYLKLVIQYIKKYNDIPTRKIDVIQDEERKYSVGQWLSNLKTKQNNIKDPLTIKVLEFLKKIKPIKEYFETKFYKKKSSRYNVLKSAEIIEIPELTDYFI